MKSGGPLLLITHHSSLITFLSWGGRIRTCECRFQRPVPYHLATPQSRFQAPRSGRRTAAHRPSARRYSARVSVARAPRLRLQPRDDGLEIVCRHLMERTGKSGPCARNRQVNDPLILCQGGSAERLISLRGRDLNARCDDDQVHLRRVFERSYRRPRARPQSRPARQKKGHVSAETRADFCQLGLARLNFPEARERDERDRGVGRTAAESAARGYTLFQSDARAARRAVAFAQSERGTQDEISFVGRDFGVGAGEFESVVLARLEGQFVVECDGLEDGLDFVVDVGG